MIYKYDKVTLHSFEGVECFCMIPESDGISGADHYKSNLKRFATLPGQTHSLNVGIVERSGCEFPDTDALITFRKDVTIGVVTADCVPILLYAPDVHAVAAVHAGWKGTIGGIINNVLDEMERRGADLSKIIAVFGPSICKDVYEVDGSLGNSFIHAGFDKYVSWHHGADEKPHLDLQGVNMERLLRRGVSQINIHLNHDCTYASGRLHSFRRDGDKAGRQLTAIVMHW